MSFITDTQLQNELAARLKRVGIDITNSAYWPTLVTDANLWAYNEIIRRMAMRGFLLTDLTNPPNPPYTGPWLEGTRFNIRLGLWYAISEGGVGDAFKADQLDKLDEREKLWNSDGMNLVCPTDPNGNLIVPSQDVVITMGTWQHHIKERPTLDHTGGCGPGRNSPQWNAINDCGEC